MDRFVAYYRVSTARQGRSGLGLEAQQASVESFVAREGGELVAPPFVEVESGRKASRPELAKAIAHARRNNARLLVAKLDRLSRNVAFLSQLMEARVDFVAADNPNATRFTVHIMAAVAEEEARAISERTKAALGAAKARGVLLGSHRPGHWSQHEEARKKGQRKATEAAAQAKRAKRVVQLSPGLMAKLQEYRSKLSLRAVAEKLNEEEVPGLTKRGWNAMSVARLIKSHEQELASSATCVTSHRLFVRRRVSLGGGVL